MTSSDAHEPFQTSVAASESDISESETSESDRSAVDPTRERERGHRCHRSECGSVGRRCFAWHSRDVRDAGGSPVGRQNERVRSRMTGQSMVDAGHRRPQYRQPSRAPLSGRLVQLHLQAELSTETPRRHHGLPRRRKVKEKRRRTAW